MANLPRDVSQLLSDDEDQLFRYGGLAPGAAAGLVHSATTDTLDSVYLEPVAPDQDVVNLVEAGEQQLGVDTIGETSEVTEKTDTNNASHGTATFSIEAHNPPLEQSEPSLSKYFGTAEPNADDPFSDDFFSSLPVLDETPTKKPVEPSTDTLEQKMNSEAAVEEMLNLTLSDSINVQVTQEANIDHSSENSNNNYKSIQETAIESVDFELEVDATEKVETPMSIEEKDDFESFTADVADTETMDALGMSPAAPSFLPERKSHDFFRQTSQTDSLPSLDLSRQVSHSSGQEQSLPPSLPQTDNAIGIVESSITSTQSAMVEAVQPNPDGTVEINQSEATSTHQPLFPPSTTLSPVDSPAHQPSFNVGRQLSGQDESLSITASPQHQLGTFQNFHDSCVGDDPFSASLQMSDSDRQHHSWIPSEATKNILLTMATHTARTYVPDRELLVTPQLVITDPQGDPVRDLVYRYMGEQEALKRQVLTVDKVTQDVDGLQKLMKNGCYRSAIDMTGRLLTQAGQAAPTDDPTVHSPDTLQLWYSRFSLMMKLRMYSIAESELIAFHSLDSPDIYYEYYPQLYPGKRGSMVPFGMRILHAELPHHLGRSQETLDRLYYILAITQKILKNLNDGLAEDGSAVTITTESRKSSQELWDERHRHTLYCIGNTLVAVRDYDAALSVFETLMEQDVAHKTSLLAGLGRIHLQIGNLPKAMEYFQQVRSATDQTEKMATTSLLMCRGFEAMCQNNFSEAYQNFKTAVQADPSNPSAVNNMAVCCLYLGKLKEALKSLEALVHSDPDKNLHEGILFNLCTLYELESSRALHKKQALLDLVSKHKGDGFPVVCLKMA